MSYLPPEDSKNTQAELLAKVADMRGQLAASSAKVANADVIQQNLRIQLAASEAIQRDLRAQLAAAETVLNDPQRVRERQALLILNEMYQFVALIDERGGLLECNRNVLKVGHIRREDFIGRTLWELPRWTASTRKDLQAAFQSTITTGVSARLEAEVSGRETELLITDMTFNPIFNEQGKVVFLVVEARDITEKKRAEAEVIRKNVELQTLYEQVRKLDQVKSLFFAMMNHELRTPLTLILGPTESLLQQKSLTVEVRQTLEMVTRNGRLLLKLVNDLLEVSRLEAGKLQLHYATCDISRLVQILASNFDSVAADRHLTYRVETPPRLLVEIDPSKIERVLLNLLSNAFKFTPDGGTVTCLLETEVATETGESATSTQVVLTVQDSGLGVPSDQCEVIFERFRQVEEGATRRFGGSGLGLAIVKDLIELHGGTIRVDEAPEGGARFIVRVPRAAPAGSLIESIPTQEMTDARMSQAMLEELEVVRPPSSSSSLSSSDMCEQSLILIVEDHPQMRQFLTEQLSSRYRVVEAENGQEGFALAQELHPDLILTDMMMPVMSGDELLAALRADSRYDDIMVVILSARGNEDLRMNLLRTGAQDYLVKPFSPEELQVRLGNLLTLHRTRRLLQDELASSQQNVEALAHTLTARRRELEVLNAELKSINKQQSNFVAVVSHEFRTTLTGIQGFSDLLTEQEWSAEEVKEYATDISTNAKRLTRMINDVLDLERMKSGKMTLHYELVDVNMLLREQADQVQHTSPEYIIVCSLDDELPMVQGDRDKFIQVVTNLLSNAVKYSPDGGEILLSSRREDGGILISIQDQGVGIREDVLKDIFMPYSRIASEKTRYIQGTGLGLSVVREIIRLHGGTIWVESTLGHGSTFYFFLPLTRAVSELESSPKTS